MPKALPHQRLQQLEQLLRRINIDTSGLASTGWAAVDEALTHTSAGLAINHEQLEFLGDAVLRLAASEYLEQHHPELSVGERSALRAQLVSDRWLAEVGEAIGISDALRIGPTAGGDATALSTMRAEATEALIGALYRAFGSLAPVHQWLTPSWERTSRAVLSDPHRGSCKSALQEWSQGQGLGLPQYSCREVSHRHGDPRRFHCSVTLPTDLSAEGWGGSRREAEQQAAASLLDQLVSC